MKHSIVALTHWLDPGFPSKSLTFNVFLMLTLLPSSDEVAAFLLNVRTLDYQDKPDYQHLKKLLASPVEGQLDFSMPEGPAKSAVKTPNPREKVRTPRGARL